MDLAEEQCQSHKDSVRLARTNQLDNGNQYPKLKTYDDQDDEEDKDGKKSKKWNSDFIFTKVFI